MKYSVSVVKRITLLIMTLALAVAMVACTGATSVKGETGATGPQGETGAQGPPGESSNEPPMAVADKPFKPVYLALGGEGVNASADVNPSAHFSDKEKAALTYEAMSSNEAVATVKVTDGMIAVTGKGAGTATVTVSAYDGVNADPATGTFDVIVVSDNAIPVVDFPGTTENFTTENGGLPGLTNKIYTANGPTVVSVMVSIDPGTAGGFADTVTVNAIMGLAGDKDDIVSVGLVEKKRGEWEITLTPKAEGKQNVQLEVKDKFGAVADFGEVFAVVVNTVPKLVTPIPDRSIAVTAIGSLQTTTAYTIAEFFDFTEVPPSGAASGEAVAGESTEVPTTPETNDHTCTASMNDTTIATVAVAADVATVTAVKTGTAEVTITCKDTETSVSDTAVITVR